MGSSISGLLRWLLRHCFQTQSNSLECITGIPMARPGVGGLRPSCTDPSRSWGAPSRLGDSTPPDLCERYDRKRNECEDQRKHCLACGTANSRHDDHDIHRAENKAEGDPAGLGR
jgi:hypothetical protein